MRTLRQSLMAGVAVRAGGCAAGDRRSPRCKARRTRRRRRAKPGDAAAGVAVCAASQNTAAALGGAVRGGRQGDRLAALHELPSGDRAADSRATRCSRTSRWWCAAPTARRAGGLACDTCHHDANYRSGRSVPGNPKWALAPHRDGLAGQDARPDLRADQGPRPQWRQGHGQARASFGGGSNWSAGAGIPAPAARPRRARRSNSVN